MSSAEAAHRRTGTAAGVLELPPAYWSCRRRIGAAAGVLELPPAYWSYRQRTGATASELELPPAYWSCRRCIKATAGVLELPSAYWNYRRRSEAAHRHIGATAGVYWYCRLSAEAIREEHYGATAGALTTGSLAPMYLPLRDELLTPPPHSTHILVVIVD